MSSHATIVHYFASQNQIVHQTLAIAMLATSVACAAEVVWPTSFLITCSKVASVLWQVRRKITLLSFPTLFVNTYRSFPNLFRSNNHTQGVMFCLIAQVIYCGGIPWDQSTADQAPAQYAAVSVCACSCARALFDCIDKTACSVYQYQLECLNSHSHTSPSHTTAGGDHAVGVWFACFVCLCVCSVLVVRYEGIIARA